MFALFVQLLFKKLIIQQGAALAYVNVGYVLKLLNCSSAILIGLMII